MYTHGCDQSKTLENGWTCSETRRNIILEGIKSAGRSQNSYTGLFKYNARVKTFKEFKKEGRNRANEEVEL